MPDRRRARRAGSSLGFALALGLVVGSFLNVVIHRLPRDESIVHAALALPALQDAHRRCDNVPLLSYLWLRGRCRRCAAPISLRYPAFELATGLVFAALALALRRRASMTLLCCAFAAALLAAAAIDFDHQIIPDEISLGGLVAGLVGMPAARVAPGGEPLAAFASSLLGRALGGGMLWIVGFAHARALGRARPHASSTGPAKARRCRASRRSTTGRGSPASASAT